MRVFDIFKKKSKTVQASPGILFPVPQENLYKKGTTADTPVEEKPKKTMKELFDEWYMTLTPEQKKRVDKKIEKMNRRAGTPVTCIVCKNPGSNKATGPFRKTKDGYTHEHCMYHK